MIWVWEYCRGASRLLEFLGIGIMRGVFEVSPEFIRCATRGEGPSAL
jgi:hypothetical protein